MNRTCIFCNQSKNIKLFKPEHIIPQTLGNSLIIETVCEECNNFFSIYDQEIGNYFKFERILYIVREKHPSDVKVLDSSTNCPEIKIPGILKYDRILNCYNGVLNSHYYYDNGKKKLFTDKAHEKLIQSTVFQPKIEAKRIPLEEQMKYQPQVKTDPYKSKDYTEKVEKAILKITYELITLILGESIKNFSSMKYIKNYLFNESSERHIRVISVEGYKESEVKIHHLYVQIIDQDILVYMRYFGEHDFMIIVPIEKNKEVTYEKDYNLIKINPQKPNQILKEKAEIFTKEYLKEIKMKKISE